MSPVSVEAVMKRLTFFQEKRYLGICASGKQQSLSSTSQPEQRSGILIVFFFSTDCVTAATVRQCDVKY